MSGSPYSVAHDPLVAGRTASVVGSGPNGLSAAVALARAGVRVTVYEAGPEPGGATRSAAVLGPGTTVDLGSAVHPFGVASPFLRTLDLSRHGLEWVQPDIPVGHPLDDGPAAVQYRSLARTAADLGPDGSAWWRLYAPLVGAWEETVAAFLGPMLRPP
ncbi:MAG: phytoene desaturase family protein, partial [Actinomycetaceae bacterium]